MRGLITRPAAPVAGPPMEQLMRGIFGRRKRPDGGPANGAPVPTGGAGEYAEPGRPHRVESGAGPPRPRSLSRRRLLKHLGIGGAAAIVAPGPTAVVLLRLIGTRDGDDGRPPGHEEPSGESVRKRRWAMVIDLRYCDGCQSVQEPPRCTTACIEGHYLPEPIEFIEVFEANLAGGGTQFIPTPCQHCQNAPCLNVCPVGAVFATTEGVILTDQERCIGCRMCMAACPYDRRFFVWGDPPVPPEALLTEYSPEHAGGLFRGTTTKCDWCPDLLRAGSLPYCALACPNNAIYFGDLETDLATNGRSLVALSRFLSENAAFNLKAEAGTRPHVFYIAGRGEAVGRDPFTPGRAATVWPWTEQTEGAAQWSR